MNCAHMAVSMKTKKKLCIGLEKQSICREKYPPHKLVCSKFRIDSLNLRKNLLIHKKHITRMDISAKTSDIYYCAYTYSEFVVWLLVFSQNEFEIIHIF